MKKLILTLIARVAVLSVCSALAGVEATDIENTEPRQFSSLSQPLQDLEPFSSDQDSIPQSTQDLSQPTSLDCPRKQSDSSEKVKTMKIWLSIDEYNKNPDAVKIYCDYFPKDSKVDTRKFKSIAVNPENIHVFNKAKRIGKKHKEEYWKTKLFLDQYMATCERFDEEYKKCQLETTDYVVVRNMYSAEPARVLQRFAKDAIEYQVEIPIHVPTRQPKDINALVDLIFEAPNLVDHNTVLECEANILKIFILNEDGSRSPYLTESEVEKLEIKAPQNSVDLSSSRKADAAIDLLLPIAITQRSLSPGRIALTNSSTFEKELSKSKLSSRQAPQEYRSSAPNPRTSYGLRTNDRYENDDTGSLQIEASSSQPLDQRDSRKDRGRSPSPTDRILDNRDISPGRPRTDAPSLIPQERRDRSPSPARPEKAAPSITSSELTMKSLLSEEMKFSDLEKNNSLARDSISALRARKDLRNSAPNFVRKNVSIPAQVKLTVDQSAVTNTNATPQRRISSGPEIDMDAVEVQMTKPQSEWTFPRSPRDRGPSLGKDTSGLSTL